MPDVRLGNGLSSVLVRSHQGREQPPWERRVSGYGWPSTSVVPPGTCLLHGPHGLTFCPTCATVPGINTIGIPLPQVPACDRCSQGVMDSTNPHLLGTCDCDCHRAENGHPGAETR
jgi:hypothetical protein